MAELRQRHGRIGVGTVVTESAIRVFLAGEGATELGGWADSIAYREKVPRLGVLEALIQREAPGASYQIVDAVIWKRIRKYRAGEFRSAERRTVLGLALMAKEASADAVVFSRDRDGEAERVGWIEAAIDDARELYASVTLAGGVAIEETEAWILSLGGDTRAETHADPKNVLNSHGIRGTNAMVDAIANATNLRTCSSLAAWLDRVSAALNSTKVE